MIDIILDEFHFSTLWNGGIFLFILFGLIIYFVLLPVDKSHSFGKTGLFLLGVLALFISIGSPLNIHGRINFGSHIIQIVLLLFIAPPLLIAGFKMKIFEQLQAISFAEKVISLITRPLGAMIIFHVLFYGYHIPSIFNYVRMDLYLNYFYLLLLFFSALLLWVPIITPNLLTAEQKVKYCSINSLLLIPFSVVCFFATENLFSIYSNMTSLIASIQLCLPDWEEIPSNFFAGLLPDPVNEQKRGAILFALSQVVMFGVVLFLSTMKSKSMLTK